MEPLRQKEERSFHEIMETEKIKTNCVIMKSRCGCHTARKSTGEKLGKTYFKSSTRSPRMKLSSHKKDRSSKNNSRRTVEKETFKLFNALRSIANNRTIL